MHREQEKIIHAIRASLGDAIRAVKSDVDELEQKLDRREAESVEYETAYGKKKRLAGKVVMGGRPREIDLSDADYKKMERIAEHLRKAGGVANVELSILIRTDPGELDTDELVHLKAAIEWLRLATRSLSTVPTMAAAARSMSRSGLSAAVRVIVVSAEEEQAVDSQAEAAFEALADGIRGLWNGWQSMAGATTLPSDWRRAEARRAWKEQQAAYAKNAGMWPALVDRV